MSSSLYPTPLMPFWQVGLTHHVDDTVGKKVAAIGDVGTGRIRAHGFGRREVLRSGQAGPVNRKAAGAFTMTDVPCGTIGWFDFQPCG